MAVASFRNADPSRRLVLTFSAIPQPDPIPMLRDLLDGMSEVDVSNLLHIDRTTLQKSLDGTRFSPWYVFNIWIVWSLIFQPENVTTLKSIATWGRYK